MRARAKPRKPVRRARRNPYEDESVDREYRDPMLDHELFVRFGAFGEGPSRVRLDAEFKNEVLGGKNFEAGLSVYAARRITTRAGAAIAIEPPDLRRAAYQVGNATNYFRHMLRSFAPAIANDQTHLVTGAVVRETYVVFDDAREQTVRVDRAVLGADGEPLLEPASVRVVETLTTEQALDHLWWNGTTPIGSMRMEWSSAPLSEDVWNYVDEDDVRENPRRGARRAPRRSTTNRHTKRRGAYL